MQEAAFFSKRNDQRKNGRVTNSNDVTIDYRLLKNLYFVLTLFTDKREFEMWKIEGERVASDKNGRIEITFSK